MARLAKYVKAPAERKRYSVDYSEWLEAGETLTAVTYEVTGTAPTLSVNDDEISPGATSCVFYVNDGDDGETYRVLVTAVTSNDQIKEDYVIFVVKDQDD